MNSKNLNFMASMAVAVIVIVASGCEELGKRWNMPVDEEVRLRAQAWADHLIAGDIEGAWALTSPSYRQFSTWQQYNPRVQGSSNWTSATVDSVRCTEDVCDVSVMVEYELRTMKMSNRRPLDYKWVNVSGDWWLHVPAK